MSKIVVENLSVIKKKKLAPGYFSIRMAPFSKVKSIRPGQFVHLSRSRNFGYGPDPERG